MMFFIVVGAVSVVGLLIWNAASVISSFDDQTSAVSIEQIVDGQFLGVKVADNTSDQYMNNVELRLAMNEGFKASNSIRKYQMNTIWLHDGQHPDSGTPAVLITVQPKRGELPDPPFEPVAVRRWEPDPQSDVHLDALPEMRLMNSPNTEDLDQLREVWSGGRHAKVGSLFGWVGRLFLFVAIGLGLVLCAGAVRSNAWRSSRWDRSADAQHEGAVLSRLQSARDAKRSRGA
ncbi:MAG: hypothetical protein H8E66_31465 [Planctomycetes bacterium]|nr:hypothetical protein [Planctomycetota bacterium]